MEETGWLSTSAATPTFQPRPRAVRHAGVKKGRRDGIYSFRILRRRLTRNARASSRYCRSTFRMPSTMGVQMMGRHIRKQIKTGTLPDENQNSAIMMKDMTGVALMAVIIG
ncbi:hypothetical protein D3C73_1321530 [compost metagenome]